MPAPSGVPLLECSEDSDFGFVAEPRRLSMASLCRDGPQACGWHGFDRGGSELGLQSVAAPALAAGQLATTVGTLALFNTFTSSGLRRCADLNRTAEALLGTGQLEEARGPLGSTFTNPRACLADRRVLFTGNSHTRYIAAMACMMLNSSQCGPLGWQYPNVTRAAAGSTQLTYLRSNYDVRDKLLWLLDEPRPPQVDPGVTAAEVAFFAQHSNLQGFWPMDREAHRLREPHGLRRKLTARVVRRLRASPEVQGFTDVVLSRGPWDLLFSETAPRLVADQIREALWLIGAALPKARVIYHLPHFHAPMAVKKAKTKHAAPVPPSDKRRWRNTCLTVARQHAMRNAVLCGVFEAATNTTVAPGLLERVRVFDQYDVTRRVAGFAAFKDGIGAHYLDVALEWITQRLLADSMCPAASSPPPAAHARFLHEVGPKACAALLPELPRTAGCDCQRPAFLRWNRDLCKLLARNLPARGN